MVVSFYIQNKLYSSMEIISTETKYYIPKWTINMIRSYKYAEYFIFYCSKIGRYVQVNTVEKKSEEIQQHV